MKKSEKRILWAILASYNDVSEAIAYNETAGLFGEAHSLAHTKATICTILRDAGFQIEKDYVTYKVRKEMAGLSFDAWQARIKEEDE